MPPIKGFMFDLDGTLLLSDRSLGGYEVLPGAIEVLSSLQERAIPFVVLTNGSAYPPAEQAAVCEAWVCRLRMTGCSRRPAWRRSSCAAPVSPGL